ncbi:MAG: gamma-glutamyltransferase [Pyrinomonadaceae bacterium]
MTFNQIFVRRRYLLSLMLVGSILLGPGSLATRSLSATPVALTSTEPVRGRQAMVTTNSRPASQIGVDILKKGGNAVDAAIAIALALAVAYPEAGNLGGGGFMMIRLADGRTTAIDYREMAPAAASRNVFVDKNGALIVGEGSSTQGYRAAGVPGTVAGLELALRKYGSGKLTWSQLIEPARRLAVEGFRVTARIERNLKDAKALAKYADSNRIFLNDGKFFAEGDLLKQPELAETLTRLQIKGPREFYEGRTGQMIVADMKAHNGLITGLDLKNYAPKERKPITGSYRGYNIVTMPPPSSGGVTMLEILNILEGYDLSKMGWASASKYHVMLEAMRRGFADRAEYIGDPDFTKVPAAGLIDKRYANALRETISERQASTSEEIRAGLPPGAEGTNTTHFTVVDAAGNAVANTYTLNDLYGSKVTVKGTGILLNDEMDDFASIPGKPNMYGLVQGERNAVGSKKRPLSSMSPTFVLRPDGSLWFALGARGGPHIITSVLQAILNVIDHQMNIQQAIDAPRLHHQWLPDEVEWEPFGISVDTRAILERLGHRFKEKSAYKAAVTAIMIEEGTNVRLGAVDARGDGAAIGY